jgi:hypothetical protein
MTKTELQAALGEATQSDKRTWKSFSICSARLPTKEIKKNVEFVVPDFDKLVKQKRKAPMGFNPKS